MRRTLREHRTDVVALVLIWAASVLVGGYIVAHQRIHPPAWVPFVGQKDFVLRAQLASVQGVLPGQGQAVTISGVRVGDIARVDLERGTAVATLRIEQRYARVYPGATVLLRPKTGLKDMVAELDPGTRASGPPLRSGTLLRIDRTRPDVNLDEILASLDADSRDALKLLVGDAGTALGRGGGSRLADVFRAFPPLSRDVARATRLVALRHTQLRRLMGNLSKLAVELGRRDRQLAAFVQGGAGTFRRFAAQDAALGRSVRLLPGALGASDRALAKIARLGATLRATLGGLDPAARALAPALAQTRPFLRTTTPVLRDELRPFGREAQPTARLLVPAARDLAHATPDLTTLTNALDAIVDELAYKAPGQQSFLFYVPWASHDTNSVLANQDGVSPLRRGLVLMSCGALQLLESLDQPKRNPTLSTLIQLLGGPDYRGLIAQKRCPFTPAPPGAGQ